MVVIDDDPILRALMAEQLSALSWRVITAEDGDKGLDAISSHRPDLVIADIGMPGLDGYGLLRHLRQTPATLDLPVIVCTSQNDQQAIDQAYRLGASHFVTKPIHWPTFLHHVQFVLRSGDTERELRAAQSEALAASRMKSAMFQVLSHELKTPLAALIGLTDVLEAAFRDRARPGETEQMGQIVDAANRLNRVVSDIMLLSKAVGREVARGFAPASLSEIVEDSVMGLRQLAAGRRITLLRRPVEPDSWIDCDLALIRQGLAKLVENAVRYAPEGSTVEIWGHERTNGQTVLSVKDDGPGLPPQRLKDCLQPFVQENMGYARRTEGLGLGLPIAKAIAEAHGGELVVQTSPGKGLLAAIVLPAARLLPAEQAREVAFA